MSALITTQAYLCYFNQTGKSADGSCLGPRSNVQGGITASMAGGSWLGALVSGFLSDRLGRKTSIQTGAIIWVIGSIIICASQDIAMLIVGRVINGIAVGICSAQVPVYIAGECLKFPPVTASCVGQMSVERHVHGCGPGFVHWHVMRGRPHLGLVATIKIMFMITFFWISLSRSSFQHFMSFKSCMLTISPEISPPTKRGRLIGAQQWAITWGILIMFYISYGSAATQEPSTAVFRIPWGVQMVPAIILFFGMFFLPESPRWLASKDRWDECKDVLVLTQGKGDPNNPMVSYEYNEIKHWIRIEREAKSVSYLELIHPKMINRTHIGLFTQIWSQLTGMNVMMYYITVRGFIPCV